MNLEQLRGFAEVALTGHFTRAAEQLHLAQPSLSRQIATLERDLGVELFHRVRGNVALTSAGERLLPLARRMLADAETARNEMAELAGLQRGRIRLGATPTLCTSLVADVLAEFHERHPGIDIEVMERGSRSLIAALMEGALDLALIVTSVAHGEARAVLDREPILSERLVVVSAANRLDPFPRSDSSQAVTLAELARVPQIAFPENYDLRVAMDTAYRAAGLTPRVAVEGVEMDAALRFAERGIGVAVVPAMVAVDRPKLRSTPLAGAELTRTVSLARRSDMAPTHASAALQAMTREVADRLSAADSATATLVRRVGAVAGSARSGA
ncbi:LysR family transcriptional regulator [Leucobacter luti]|uniref:DNA-binding transcriptional LysR family regulator n=1 Tax=Leucobacter luti TaxID=340320 RepID=A0A4R6RX84_9MICO|nr:LysR substrate-binding domain-containing protein [Leucobacter luti]MCW2288417.1 DNA-binding transcriptional LysR family regulator [Leucobacter luti]QYM75644.1 LysR family transcriptional regulator [Leucobacter luti]TCK45426.1 DNA-binding transcriptional LysR family regulator [Leucobacter luti]TDP91671.1 DNA-binding transcriptional LysR family regulator [Leucobacter luti]